jgi:hypothetical protein
MGKGKKETIRSKGQALWRKAMGVEEGIELQFPDKATMHRARFALYDACRGNCPDDIQRAKEGIEICVDAKNCILTMQRRDIADFQGVLEDAIDIALGKAESPIIPPLGDVSESRRLETTPKVPIEELSAGLEESLKRFQEKLRDKAAGELRPATPYFNRED